MPFVPLVFSLKSGAKIVDYFPITFFNSFSFSIKLRLIINQILIKKNAKTKDIETYVAVRKIKDGGRTYPCRNEDFDYDEQQDHYICPAEEYLTSNGTSYTKKVTNVGGKGDQVKKYRQSFSVCGGCAFRHKCLSASELKSNKGRLVARSEYQDYKKVNAEQVKLHKDYTKSVNKL